MTTYIMTINTDADIEQSVIDRFKRLYSNNQDSFIITYSEDKYPNGFAITKDDNIVATAITSKKIDVTGDVKKEIFKQNKIIKDGARYSKDTSVTKGDKPYGPIK